jgi:hypothetical protein
MNGEHVKTYYRSSYDRKTNHVSLSINGVVLVAIPFDFLQQSYYQAKKEKDKPDIQIVENKIITKLGG